MQDTKSALKVVCKSLIFLLEMKSTISAARITMLLFERELTESFKCNRKRNGPRFDP